MGNVDIVENGYDYAMLLTLKGYVFKDSKKRTGWAIRYVFCALKISRKCNLLYIDRVYSDVLFADVGELENAAKEIVHKLDKDILKIMEKRKRAY
ncbi:hypothetical protein FAK_22270 [Desulfoferula mesophila]|uniref:Uncharacterized protein n=1 Tax=Desulfoferula mesophila TaxID=3058419 RepID=A0AAU9EML8_9BACT|nr:hypothetical protein FAK_22270 [Desulfoferula mesophilus]